jgi:cholest-4-en-3-one 26-monooxygenase
MPEPHVAPGFDLTDPDLYAQRVPQEEFAELRRAAPVRWNPQPSDMGFNDDGFWAVTRHKDVVAISRDSETFSSYENTAIVRFMSGSTRDQIEMQRVIMLNIDPPHHTKVRGIVSRGFTPRASGRRWSRAPATSSPTSPASCRCRPSPS